MKPGLILSLLFLLSFGWLSSPIQSASPTATVAALLPGDDPCVYRPSVLRFFCDTNRSGGDAEFVLVFGIAGDTPLLGGVNGDGRDDPCVYRPSVQRFFCDTARNGGDAEQIIMFGIPDDIPLLGDLYGDGRDEPCVYRPSVLRFFCDTARDGGDADLIIAFGIAGDVPLIGSVARQFGVYVPIVTR
ncbi:hypothetical protein [Chloroflexus sp.]|uniref:hypothetical protein n=1 Tax=Chloroflexus sp. TaxID=1904827 RepID=UPI002ADD5E65|nr:hypothetical protein [Chloroflexus sp.]